MVRRLLSSFNRICLGPLIIALLTWSVMVTAIDPGGDFPHARQGPGLTVDECFNVQQGVFLTSAIRAYGLSILHPSSLEEVFQHPAHLPDHPPLGRLWIGFCHDVARAVMCDPAPEQTYITACARTASTIAFAALVFIVGAFSTSWFGRWPGIVASLAVVLMPRLFGHGHLAALETAMGLTFAVAILSVAHMWRKPSSPTWQVAFACGIFLGLALLTKIQAILILPVVTVWALWNWRQRALLPLCVWSVTGFVVFFCGWPWLWMDPLERFVEYFGRTTDRVELSVWYFGEKFSDRAVPWHYSFVMFLTTVPIGLHALGVAGLISGERPAWREPREWLMIGGILFPLILFACPRIAVYDGTRLFLIVFPLWAVFVARSTPAVIGWMRRKLGTRLGPTLLVAILVAQGCGHLRTAPCFLSYYNLAVGGPRGAERLGFEPTYWGDSLCREFIQDVCRVVPKGSLIAATPSLYSFQWDELRAQSPLLRDRQVTFRPFGTPEANAAEFLLLFQRRSDLPDYVALCEGRAQPVAELRREGILLAALYQISDGHHPEPQQP